jgi:uroporphyrinogen III methyltransferase/synthase
LEGVSVVVTRAHGQSEPLSAALSDRGASVVALPVIAIADPVDGGEAMREAVAGALAGRYDWVVFSSGNAVERFVDVLGGARDLGRTKIAAVGDATAAALAARGLATDVVPSTASAEALASAIPDAPRRAATPASAAAGTPSTTAGTGEGRVLFPRAAGAREVLVSRLRDKGWDVDDVEAYRTVAAGAADGATEDALSASVRADVVTFTSPSTVRFYMQLVSGRGMPPVVACIGPVTARAASRAGLRVDVVAGEQSADGLVRALMEHLERHRP